MARPCEPKRGSILAAHKACRETSRDAGAVPTENAGQTARDFPRSSVHEMTHDLTLIVCKHENRNASAACAQDRGTNVLVDPAHCAGRSPLTRLAVRRACVVSKQAPCLRLQVLALRPPIRRHQTTNAMLMALSAVSVTPTRPQGACGGDVWHVHAYH